MTDRERGFLDAVLADPSDDFPRLVMADWLEDEGRVERAEFIRVQVELAALQCLCKNRDGTFNGACGFCNSNELRRRERELLRSNVLRWLMLSVLCVELRESAVCIGLNSRQTLDTQLYFRRGFIASVSLTLADFMAHAGAIFAAAPVECVSLSDRNPSGPITGGAERGRWFWLRRDFPITLWRLIQPDERCGISAAVPTRNDAERQMSAACVRLGRSLSGLREIDVKSYLVRI